MPEAEDDNAVDAARRPRDGFPISHASIVPDVGESVGREWLAGRSFDEWANRK